MGSSAVCATPSVAPPQPRLLKGVENILLSLETGGEAAAVRGSRAVMLSEFAATYGVLGSYADAMARARDAIKIQLDQVNSHPADVTMRAALAKSYKVHGDVLWWQRTDLLMAIEELQNSVKSYAGLMNLYPDDRDANDWQLFQLRALVSIGDIYYDGSVNPSVVCSEHPACLSLAQTYFRRAQELGLMMQSEDGNNFQSKNGLLAARERLAKINEMRGDLTLARTTYAELLKEYQRMGEAQPDNSKWQENLMALYWRVGGIEEKSCRADLALFNYEKALEVARKLHQSEPGRLDWSHELSLSLKHSARAYEALEQPDAAEKNYRDSLEINEYLIKKQPANEDLKTDRDQIQKALAQIGTKRPACATVSNP